MCNSQYTAIIPARGGSKGLPKKNIIALAGKPLIAYTIEAALKSNSFSKVIVSTDCPDIKKVSLEYSIDVIDRPSYLATDTANSLDVISHTLEHLKKQGSLTTHFMLLQPTSPLRTQAHINEAIVQYEKSNKNTLVSISKCEDSPLKTLYRDEDGVMQPKRTWKDLTSARQSLPVTFKPNGAIYIAQSENFLLDQLLIDKCTEFYVMDEKNSIDIDGNDDLLYAEKMLETK